MTSQIIAEQLTAPANDHPVFQVQELNKTFGKLVVAKGISLKLAAGSRTALIGPNGAGKSTFVNLVTGALKPSSGQISLDGEDVTKLPQAERVRRGLVRSFQVTRLFKSLSVEDNVRLAILNRAGYSMNLFRPVSSLRNVDQKIHDVLAAIGLKDQSTVTITSLAYGQQRLVELGLVLALEPKVLLLDEPAAGVPKGESEVIIEAMNNLPPSLAVLLIEHDMDLVFRFSEQIAVLAGGELIAKGSKKAISADPKVRELYLGPGE